MSRRGLLYIFAILIMSVSAFFWMGIFPALIAIPLAFIVGEPWGFFIEFPYRPARTHTPWDRGDNLG